MILVEERILLDTRMVKDGLVKLVKGLQIKMWIFGHDSISTLWNNGHWYWIK